MGTIRKNRFFLLCLAALLILLSGALIKHTLLGQIRSDVMLTPRQKRNRLAQLHERICAMR